MIKAIFFDFYNTLAYFWPPLEEIQEASTRELGLNIDKSGIRMGYAAADLHMSRENARSPLADRSPKEKDAFFTEYERIILQGAGLDVTPDMAWQVWRVAVQVPKRFAPFDDVVPALKQLRGRGITVGLITNLRQDMHTLTTELGISPYLDFWVTSVEVGAEKPHPPIFAAALERARVAPAEAVHVGDQHGADVEGARAVGIAPVLLDREGVYPDVRDCPVIATLPELDALIDRGL